MSGAPITLNLEPVTHDLGGFRVHRTLPHRERTTIGPFIFFDQMGPANLAPGQAVEVRPHPHINLATVTYLFAGAIDHRDSLGTFQTIEPGAVNLMTAGRGITHSERSPPTLKSSGSDLFGIQTWLALPAAREEMDPAFEHVGREELPEIEGINARARIVMGSLWGETSPVTCHSPTIYADIEINAGGAIPVDPEADERAIALIDGDATIDGSPLAVSALAVLRPGIAATLRSERGARLMLCGGAPLDGPRFVWWNFVSSRRERINQAKEDWRAGRFDLPPDDNAEFIPLPEVAKTVSYP